MGGCCSGLGELGKGDDERGGTESEFSKRNFQRKIKRTQRMTEMEREWAKNYSRFFSSLCNTARWDQEG